MYDIKKGNLISSESVDWNSKTIKTQTSSTLLVLLTYMMTFWSVVYSCLSLVEYFLKAFMRSK